MFIDLQSCKSFDCRVFLLEQPHPSSLSLELHAVINCSDYTCSCKIFISFPPFKLFPPEISIGQPQNCIFNWVTMVSQSNIVAANLIVAIAATIAVALRFLARYMLHTFGADDFLILAALVSFSAEYNTCMYANSRTVATWMGDVYHHIVRGSLRAWKTHVDSASPKSGPVYKGEFKRVTLLPSSPLSKSRFITPPNSSGRRLCL